MSIILPTTCVTVSETLGQTLNKTLDAITDVFEDIAIIVWLLDERSKLLIRDQSDVGVNLKNKFGLALNDNDFVVECFNDSTPKELDDLLRADAFLNIEYAKARRWQSAVAYPLQTSQERYGVLSVYTIGHQGFTRREKRQLETIVNLIPAMIESQLKSDQIKGLLDLPSRITNRTSLKQTLSDVAKIIRNLLQADYVDIYTWNDQIQRFEEEFAVIYPPEPQEQPPYPQSEGATYQILKSSTPLEFTREKTPTMFTPLEDDLGIQIFLGMRLVVGKEIVGVLHLNYMQQRSFDDNFRELLVKAADTIAFAISEARLYLKIEALRGITEAVHEELDIDDTLNDAVEGLAKLLNVQQAALLLFNEKLGVARLGAGYLDPNCQDCVSAAELAGQILLAENPILEWLKKHKAPLRVIDAQTDPILTPIFDVVKARHITSVMIVPMINQTGKVIGVISLETVGRRREFSDEETNLASLATAQITIAYENARLYEETEIRSRNLEDIRLITEAVHRELDIEDTLQHAVDGLTKLFDVQQAGLVLFDDTAPVSQWALKYIDPKISFTDNPAISWLQENKTPLRVVKAQTDPLLAPVHKAMKKSNIVSIMLAPLINKAGDIIGTVGLDVVGEQRDFSDEEAHLAQLAANQIAIAYENAQLYEDLEDKTKELSILNKGLDALNDAGQKLTAQIRAPEIEIIELIYEQAQALVQCEDMYIALYNDQTKEIRFGLYLERGERKFPDPRPFNEQEKGKTEEIFLTKQPILHKTEQEAANWYNQPGRQKFTGETYWPSWLGVPMIIEDKVIGVIAIYDIDREYVYDETHLAIFSALANQAAIALDNARLYYDVNQQLDRRVKGLGVLNDAGRKLTAQIRASETEIIELIYEQTQALTQSEDMFVVLYNDKTGELRVGLYLDHGKRKSITSLPLDKDNRSQTMEIILTKQPILHKTKQEVENWYNQPNRQKLVEDIATSWLGVPLILEDKAIGAIGIYDFEREYVYDETDLEIFSALANQAAIALDNTKLYYDVNQQLERRVIGLGTLNDVGQKLTSQIRASEEEIIELVYEQAQALTKCKDMYIALYDEATNLIRFALYIQQTKRELFDPRPLKDKKLGKTEAIIITQKPLLHRTRQESIDWYKEPNHQEFIGVTPSSWLGVPMIVENKVVGVIVIYDVEQEYVYDETDLEIFSAMANQAAIALDNARLFEQRAKGLAALDKVGRKLTSQIRASEAEIIETLYEQVQELTQPKEMYLALYNNKTKKIRPTLYLEGGQQRPLPTRILDEAKRDRTEEVILNKTPLLHQTRQEIENWYKQPAHYDFNREALACAFVVPMVAEDQVIGVIAVYDNEQEYAYDEVDVEVFSALASQAAIALNNARLYQETVKLQDEVVAVQELRTLGTAIAALQHRISNTFNIIVPNVTRLRKRVDAEDETVTEILDIIERNARYTSDIITRIQAPLKEIEKLTININAILNGIIDQVIAEKQSSPTDSTVEIKSDLDETIPTIQASSGQLTEIFRNLLENAYQAMPQGGQITLTSHHSDGHIQVRVKDTGGGIPPDIQKRLFKQPVPSKEQGGGAGLGLWLGQLMLQSIGGRIKIENTGAKGTTISVQIPVRNEERSGPNV